MFDERLTDFIQYLRFEKRYSPHTLTAYQKDLEQFGDYLTEEFGFNELKLISHFHVRGWLAGMKGDKHTARTINRKISSLNSYYKYMMRLGITDKNPVRQLHAQRLPERLPVYLKESESQELLEELQFDEGFKGLTDRLICELLYRQYSACAAMNFSQTERKKI